MRSSIVNVIVSHLAAGHSVTVGTVHGHSLARELILDSLYDLDLQPDWSMTDLKLSNGAVVQFISLAHYSGRACLHTPMVVLLDVEEANQTLVPDAWAIACKFPSGSPPIVIEC